jgi:hypothetical protein
MSWEQFVHIGTAIVYWTLLWFLIAIPAAILIYAIGRFAPNTPGEASGRLLAHKPGPTDASTQFRACKADARQRLELGTVRVLVDRKHARLKRELAQIRATIDRRLQQITRASRSTSGASLMDLLTGFKDDIAKATQFDEIDDGFPDKRIALSKARMKFGIFLFAIVIITLFNLGLLYLFFDEFFGGLTLPYLGIDVALIAAAFFPLVESFGGIAAEAVKEKDDSPSTKLIKSLALAFGIFSLAALEYYIFYKLFESGFQDQLDFPPGGLFHKTIAFVGPTLTIFQALFGGGVARELERIKELGTITSIKQHIAGAQHFINGLEGRYDRIEEAAARASESIDEFASQVKGRGEAELPAVSLLSEERKRFLEAVDSVNPNRWKREIAPSEGDIDAVTAYAWFLPLGVAFVLGIFAFVFAPAVQDSGVVTAASGLAVGLALLVGFVVLLAGGALFDRATSAVESDSTWKDVLSPRDGAFKAFSLFAFFSIAVGVLWICVQANGWVGVAEAALLIGILAGISWISSYIDLMLRGCAYLGTVGWSGILWLFRMVARLAWSMVVIVTAVVVASVLFILHVLAWPVTWVRSLVRRDVSQFTTSAT